MKVPFTPRSLAALCEQEGVFCEISAFADCVEQDVTLSKSFFTVMPIHSAGLMMCRKRDGKLEFFLVHPGGPFFARKNEGAWGIPKGLPEENEGMEEAAQREFFEETGIRPEPPFHSIGSAKLKSGKTIHAWTFLGSWDSAKGIVSNQVEIEWPPRSGKKMSIPEIDRAEWMDFEKASLMINLNLISFLERAREIY